MNTFRFISALMPQQLAALLTAFQIFLPNATEVLLTLFMNMNVKGDVHVDVGI